MGAKATEYHQFNYPVAIEDESRLTHPRWASRIIAPSLPYMPTGRDPDSEIAKRSLQTLRKAGIL